MAGQQNRFPFAGQTGAAVLHIGADTLVQDSVGITVIYRGVHVGAGNRNISIAVTQRGVGNAAEGNRLRLGSGFPCRTAVNYRTGFSQQVLRLRSSCVVKEPAQHHLVGLQQHKAECRQQGCRDSRQRQRHNNIGQRTAVDERPFFTMWQVFNPSRARTQTPAAPGYP